MGGLLHEFQHGYFCPANQEDFVDGCDYPDTPKSSDIF
jgi:hypothetical protein